MHQAQTAPVPATLTLQVLVDLAPWVITAPQVQIFLCHVLLGAMQTRNCSTPARCVPRVTSASLTLASSLPLCVLKVRPRQFLDIWEKLEKFKL